MYDIFIEGEKVGMGLSPGEVNQWLLDTIDELTANEQEIFKKDFGYTEGNFEDFLYDHNHKYPLQLRFGKEFMVIDDSDF